MSEWFTVANATDIHEDAATVVDVDGIQIILSKVEGTIYAIEDRCTHMDFPLSDGLVESGEIMCLHHGARFCLKSGNALSAPAFNPTTSFPVQVIEGKVQVKV